MAYDNKPIRHPKDLWLVFHMMFVVEALSLKQCAVLSPLNLRGLRTAHSQRKRRRIQPANPLPPHFALMLDSHVQSAPSRSYPVLASLSFPSSPPKDADKTSSSVYDEYGNPVAGNDLQNVVHVNKLAYFDADYR